MDPIIIILIVVLVVVTILVVAAWLLRDESNFKMDIGGATPRAAGGTDQSSETGMQNRLQGLGIVSGSVFALLLGKLWSMQLVSSEEYARQAERNRSRTITTEAPRGRILDRNGVELVKNSPCLTVVASKDVLNDEVEIQLLANLLGMPKVAVMRKIQDDSEGAQAAHTVASNVSRKTVAFIDEHPHLFPGIAVEERTQRTYPFGEMACQLLGYTGNVTTELLEQNEQSSTRDTIQYELGDTVGQAGVEYQYESVLQGIRGEQYVYVDSHGEVTDYSGAIDAQSGSDVVLTIDAKIQKAAEDGLKHAIEMGQRLGDKDCKAGACVVLDCEDGSVLAIASAPTFNPSVFNGGISNDDWEELSGEDSEYPLMNRAIAGQYMSASTIKPLSAFAALDYDKADKKSKYDCTGYWTGFGEQYGQYCWNRQGHGEMTLETGITYSCDVVFYEIGKAFFLDEKNQDGLQETFRRWGLGKATGIDLPSEGVGRVPDAAWKEEYFANYNERDREWRGGDITNLVIGQGDLLVTPLQMACVYMGIANHGTIWRPHVLKEVRSQSGQGTVVAYKPETIVETTEPDINFEIVEKGLHGVIYDEDPAIASHFNNLSVEVAGKTGTGEKEGEMDTGWFCAYAPADKPKYVAAAVVEKGGFGSTSALYAVRDVLGGIFDQPDDSVVSTSEGAR